MYQKIDEDYKVRMPDYAIKRLGLCKNDIVRFEVVGDAVVMSKAVLDCDNLLQGQNKCSEGDCCYYKEASCCFYCERFRDELYCDDTCVVVRRLMGL